MDNVNEQTLDKVDVMSLLKFLGLATTASILPFYIHIQWLTGPIVNALLIIVFFIVGIRSALVLCLIPSLMALVGGLIPAILAPVVPFIMIGNVIYIISIDRIYTYFINKKYAYLYGVVIGAIAKFIFIYFSTSFIAKLIIKQELMQKVAQMMSWPQLATAVMGGMIAWIVLKWLKRI